MKNAFYAQSGGVTAVINASACGVIETARKHKSKIGKVYAGRNGIIGALTEDLIDTSKDSAAAIAALRHTPSGAFGSCRYKLKGIEEHRAQYERLIEVFKAHNIGYFFYNGGGDSADTCLKVSQISEKMGYPIIAVHVPKTVDNDLPITDNCPGFGSVAKYIAVSTLEATFDVASMAKTSTKVFVLEVMGRHAGWIALYGGVGGSADIILLPEIPFTMKRVAEVINQRDAHGHHSTLIVVAEGAHLETGALVTREKSGSQGEDRLGGIGERIAKLAQELTGKEARECTLGHLQRGGPPTSLDRILALRFGVKAVQIIQDGKFGRMVSYQQYQVGDVSIEDAVSKLRLVEKNNELVLAARSVGISFGDENE